MKWNWQQKEWPQFKYCSILLEPLEKQFLHRSGVLFGTYKHIGTNEKENFIVDLISDEAIKTSEIEGEYLNRDSVQSSIRRNLGLGTDNRKIPLAEQGIAEMMVDLHQSFHQSLTHTTLFNWHKMITNGRRDLQSIGAYRTHKEPMQVVSGALHKPKVHFEAPPSEQVMHEMNQFITWFNQTAPQGEAQLPNLTRAGIAHLYFVCIHPFEDGNGRIGRALSEKVLSQSLHNPALVALSHTIEKNRKAYYTMLEDNNKTIEITQWLMYFAQTVLEAQASTQRVIDFLIEKAKFYDKARGKLNPRQERVVARMFEKDIDGFKGGLSAENYISITKTSRATATRDLQDLVEKGFLTRKGEKKSTRYYL